LIGEKNVTSANFSGDIALYVTAKKRGGSIALERIGV
jgi:hypothetical protein